MATCAFGDSANGAEEGCIEKSSKTQVWKGGPHIPAYLELLYKPEGYWEGLGKWGKTSGKMVEW